MNRILYRAALGALLLAAAVPAHAGDSEDFAGCDGLRKPKAKDDGMRGVASLPGYGFALGGAQTAAAATMAACTRALTGGKLLPGQTLREAHLLRARAAAKLRLGDSGGAIADLDQADRAIAGRRGELFFDRSMGASFDLLRAIALVQQGEAAAALPLADRAAAARPYAVQVQLAAAMIRETARHGDPAVEPRWEPLVRLDPQTGTQLITLETSLGRYESAAAIARAAPLRPAPLARDEDGADGIAALGRHGRALLDSTAAGYDLAYALAAAGDVPGARAALDAVARSYAVLSGGTPGAQPGAAPASTGTGTGTNPPASALASTGAASPASPTAAAQAGAGSPVPAEAGPATQAPASALTMVFGPRRQLAEARIALAEGRLEDAARLADGPLPASRPAADLRLALMKAKGDQATSLVAASQPDPLAARRRIIGDLAEGVLIANETGKSVIDYQRSRPNVLAALVGAAFSMGTTLLSGIPKTTGFKETANPDGTIVVEYTGSTPSAPMVQEMTLLRAAEIARAAGKPGFSIVGRQDYTQFLAQTQYGVTLSRTPTGHKTALTIELLDSTDAAATRGFEAGGIIDRLGPLYYDAKAKA